MKRILATLLFVAASAQADPVLLKDINTGIRIPTAAPVQMGAYWYFNSCNDGIGCELWRTDGTGPGTSLVADIRPGSRGSNPTGLTVIGDTLYFAADDGTHGIELWKSDGTASGTVLVRDIVPGSGSSGPESLVAAGGQLFFTATDSAFGRELWKSDGSAGGTLLVKDINSGAGGSSITALFASGTRVVFSAFDGVSGTEPWRSDGTPEGTFQLKDVNPGSDSSMLLAYAVAGPHVFFSTFSGPLSGTYVTDGTVAGTTRVGPPASQGKFAANGSRVYYSGFEASTGYELWVSDGTLAGTYLVRDITPGTGNSDIYGITPLGTGVAFLADDGSTGAEPWFSDGTLAGTVQLGDLNSGLAPVLEPGFTSSGDSTIFVAWSTGNGPSVWATDGTPPGTRLVKDIHPGVDGVYLAILGKAGPFVYLSADDGVHGRELWRTDGTTDGTVMVTEHTAGSSTQGGDTSFLAKWSIGDRFLYSTGADYPTFITDGTTAEPIPLTPSANQPTRGSTCDVQSRSVGRYVYFVAYDPLHGCELWRSDGTPGATFLVKDIRPGPGGSDPRNLTAANGWLYFTARDPAHNTGAVWRTDGTEAGTALVESGGVPSDLVVAGNYVFFLADTLPWSYREPWLTAIGSTQASPASALKPGLSLKNSEFLTSSGSAVFFAADDFVHGKELWTSDGTANGTRLVKDLAPGSLHSVFNEFGAAAGKVFFAGPGHELWMTDGTDAGTAPRTSSAGTAISAPSSFVSADGQVFFSLGLELWRSDGTGTGTYVVGTYSPWLQLLTSAGPWVYFMADYRQLWRSDGTVAGTVLVKEFTDEIPYGLTPFGRRVYFPAQDPLGNTFVYRSEGDPASTVMLFAISRPDLLWTGSLSPAATPAGLFLFDNDPVAGFEPSFLASEPGLDADGDGIPDLLELDLGRDPQRKDNDIFSAGEGAGTLFAMQMYRDFLGREGDAAGIPGWAGAVASGAWSWPQVIDAFLSSAEFSGFVEPVVRLYFATFLRVPDYNGLMFNAGLVRNGSVTPVQLADFFAASPEFLATYGSLDNTQFVTLLYNNVLGRAPDPDGLGGWVALLSGGMSRGQVLHGFAESPEYQAAMANEIFVTMMYTGMLRRTPDTAGFAGWVNLLDAGTYTREQVINGFFLSGEYRARFLPN